uniref:NADH-ubiquinone oxidoreductase chain 6 n=1 Tax=Apteroperla tikumana TaxID=609060 RepID=A0A0K0WW05_9NEOP|nr:NADH dehydrogenase subunit 6 [Apteroperla tikumana]AKS28892.1 NADH dehydrogenase subunit 6 [Apteroperla tikumana]
MYQLTLMIFTIATSLIFTQMTHPLAMGMMLLVQTLLICLLTGLMAQSFWFSYILFLVFLGGMLVLFIYVTSLASNEMFSLSLKMIIFSMLPISVIGLLLLTTDNSLWVSNLLNNDTLNMSDILNYQESAVTPLLKLYNQPTSFITLMLVLYLFLTLIAVVKITSISYGPLRQSN